MMDYLSLPCEAKSLSRCSSHLRTQVLPCQDYQLGRLVLGEDGEIEVSYGSQPLMAPSSSLSLPSDLIDPSMQSGQHLTDSPSLLPPSAVQPLGQHRVHQGLQETTPF